MIQREQITGHFLFTTDKSKLDIRYIQQFLSIQSYWAKNVPIHIVERSIENSTCVGIYDTREGFRQIGFARVITDEATFAYLGDVFVDEDYRGKGLSKKLMAFIMSWQEMQGLRRMILATRDAHSLYASYGFTPLKSPEKFMEVMVLRH
jgi:GNAT superfamily N-acetyltransferase